MKHEFTTSGTATIMAQPRKFIYRRMPSALMPAPSLPERIILPHDGIADVFQIRIATHRILEDEAFAVRWQVYCQELGYEPAENFPDRRERDADDDRSVQVVVTHRTSGQPVGCFRLMLADAEQPSEPFHLERVCGRLAPERLPSAAVARRGIAELSRFCILAPFRRFDAATEQPPFAISSAQWQAEAIHRHGMAGLMWLCAAHIAASLRLDFLIALMEPRLERLGQTLGFRFTQIGDPVEFRGERVPYRIDRRSLRGLLEVPQTADLMIPFGAELDLGACDHPLLAPYLEARTTRVFRMDVR